MTLVDPRNFVVADTLRDGTVVTIRAIRPDDRGRLLEAFKKLDRASIYRRFFNPKRELTDAELKQFTEVDFDHVVALVVTTKAQNAEIMVAGGRYITAPPSRSAEVAFTTEKDYQGRGIARLLLARLARIAREKGVTQFEAYVLAENQPMLSVFRRSGLPMQQRSEGNAIHVALSLVPECPGMPAA